MTNPNVAICASSILAQLRALQAEIIRQMCYDPMGIDARYIFQRLSAVTSEVETLQRYLSAVPPAPV